MSNFNLTVVSPQEKILEVECSELTLPTTTGEITVLGNHAPLFSELQAGEMIVADSAHQKTSLAVTGGFISVFKNKVSVLVDFGIRSDEIDEKVVMEAKAMAEKRIAEAKTDQANIDARAELVKAMIQLRVLEQRKHH